MGSVRGSEAVDVVVAALGAGIDALDSRELAARLGDVERAIRRLEAVAVSVVAAADRREAFRDDGQASVRGWVKASIRVSDGEVTHRVRTARLCTDLPVGHDELATGRLGLAQVRELARAHANPRCGDQLTALRRYADHRDRSCRRRGDPVCRRKGRVIGVYSEAKPARGAVPVIHENRGSTSICPDRRR